MKEGRGVHFDPDLIDVFMIIEDDFRRIALEFADYEEEKKALTR